MKEYTEAKDLEEKYKAQSSEKGRQLEAEINRFKQDASNFQAQAQANGQEWAQSVVLNCKKRTRIRLCTTSFSTTNSNKVVLKWIL
jgi:outer membrane protein